MLSQHSTWDTQLCLHVLDRRPCAHECYSEAILMQTSGSGKIKKGFVLNFKYNKNQLFCWVFFFFNVKTYNHADAMLSKVVLKKLDTYIALSSLPLPHR